MTPADPSELECYGTQIERDLGEKGKAGPR